jgi:phosphate transport system substrate-binding protein
MQNSAGKFLMPNPKSFAAAAAPADWVHARGFNPVMTNAPGASSYPIAAPTFVLLYKQPKNAPASTSARNFLDGH